jgi:glycosyltransferase involved in cell wall biosynthesis
MQENKVKKVLYAPNVHSGGGLILLKTLLLSFPKSEILHAILDSRCKIEIEKLNINNLNVIYWVKPTILSRITSELTLYKVSHKYLQILCFHNIPPILCRSKNISIYFQNKLIISDEVTIPKERVLFATKLERLIIKVFYRPYMQYYTQTNSTNIALKNWISEHLKVQPSPKVFPFLPLNNFKVEATEKKWDFLYISSGEDHKNILRLLEAWRLMSLENIKPSLAITIGGQYSEIIKLIENQYHDLNITNLGALNYDNAILQYQFARAYIHPSLKESLGLTLIEADKVGLPILAPEMDYVRDVCKPTETFDPYSPLSIARSVQRFIGVPIKGPIFEPPEKFWSEISIN